MSTSGKREMVLAAATLLAILTACGDPSVTAPERVPQQGLATEARASAIQADIARLRASPRTGGTSLGRGTTAWDMADHLERVLVQRSTPRYSYDPFMLNGASTITVSGSPPASRTVEVSAWTHCSGCVSASTETGGELQIIFVQYGTSYPYPRRFSNLSPYSSGWWYFSVSGERVNASVSTEHYAKYAWTVYTRRSSAGVTV